MAKRNRTVTPSKIEKRVKEGRGEGHGASYKPWLTIRDVPSQGLCSRIKGWKTRRVHHFLSQLETSYFYLLEWSPLVTDIREQYPLLPLESTLEISRRFNIKHPADPMTKEPIVMTTDFLIDVRNNDQNFICARTIKMAGDLSSKRTIEKLEIERTFWKEKGIDWGIVTEKEMPQNLVKNIEWIHSSREIADFPQLNSLTLAQIEPHLFQKINESGSPLSQTALSEDVNSWGLSLGPVCGQ